MSKKASANNTHNIISLFLYLTVLGILCAALSGCAHTKEPVFGSGFYFDTVIQITLYDAGREECLAECLSLAEQYEQLFSPTIEGSDIWNINHSSGEPVEVSDETIHLLQTALSYCELTGGRIDITIESVSRLWDFHTQNSSDDLSRKPSDPALSEALPHVDYRNVVIDGNTVALLDPDASVSLGFIAKGYVADRMKEYLLSQNIKSAIINLGGNLVAVGNRPDGTSFQFGIQKPFDVQGTPITVLSVSDSSVVSSGIYERYFYQDDILYHHLLDPENGYPIQNNLLSVTILSGSSAVGDALSTSCFVLGLEDGMALVESLDNTEAVFITDDYALHCSSGLQNAD